MSLHVVAEDPGPAQVLLADVAEVRPGVGVHVYVVGELQGAAEALVAERTLVADAGVRQLVALERALLFEGLLADGALVRPRVRVQPLVSAQGAGEGEALAAVGAGVGFLSGVDPQVLRHVDLLGEALPAGGALKRTLARVDPQVFLQRRRLETVSAANWTAVLLFLAIDADVCLDSGVAILFDERRPPILFLSIRVDQTADVSVLVLLPAVLRQQQAVLVAMVTR